MDVVTTSLEALIREYKLKIYLITFCFLFKYESFFLVAYKFDIYDI